MDVGRFALEMILREFDEKFKNSSRSLPFVIGIGSGSTIIPFFTYLVDHIIEMTQKPDIVFIPTSEQARFLILERLEILSNSCSFRLGTLDEFERIELTIDGADAVYLDEKVLIKGGGAAHLQEKIVAEASESCVILVADDKKINKPIENVNIPVEVVPFAVNSVKRSLGQILKGSLESCAIRTCQPGSGKIGPIVTDNGNLILDLKLKSLLSDLEDIDENIRRCAGVLCTGIFWKLPRRVTIVYPDAKQEFVAYKMY